MISLMIKEATSRLALMASMRTWMQLGDDRRTKIMTVSSLQELCVNKIIKNLPTYTKKTYQPFKHLSAKALTRLHTALCNLDMHSIKYAPLHIQKVFFGGNAERLFVDMERWYLKDSIQLFSLISRIGKVCVRAEDSLLVLYLDVVPEDLMSHLHKALTALRNLEVLYLYHRDADDITDETLQVIGANLRHLKQMNIPSGKVGDQGIKYLCVDDGVYGKCKKLEFLNFSCGYNDITSEGALVALENLPELETWDHPQVFNAVLKYSKKHGKQLTKFQANVSVPYFNPDDYIDEVSDVNNETLEIFVTTVPNLSQVSLKGGQIKIKASTICKAEKIDNLILRGSFLNQAYLEEIVEKLNINILLLNIKCDTEIDISIVAQYCTNLQALEWHCKSSKKFKYSLENKLKKLTQFIIRDPDFPAALLKSMLTCEDLDSAQMFQVKAVNNKFLADVLLNCAKNKKIFSKLTYIFINSGINVISFSMYALIICMAPKLEEFLFGGLKPMSERDKKRLEKYLAYCRSMKTTRPW